MAYGDFKNPPRRTASEKVLYDKAFKIVSDPKYDGYQCRLASVVYKIFDNEARVTSTHTGAGIISENQQLVKELLKPITRKFERCKLYSSY